MTVQLATERDARREVARHKRARTYSGPGFGPRSFECAGIGIGIDIGIGDAKPAGWNGDFATLFSGGTVYQSAQTDCGLDYGLNLLANAGNTSTSTIAVGGLITGATVPIWVKATNSATVGSGATFNVYYDGLGTTAAMTGVTPTATVPVALTGAGAGLTLTWSAGTGVTGEISKAVCRLLADQSGNSWHFTQATAGQQPIVTAGVGGMPGLLFDGVNDTLASLFVPANPPGTTPLYQGMVFRQIVWPGGTSGRVQGSSNAFGVIYAPGSTPNLTAYDGSSVANSGAAIGQLVICEWSMTNNALDTYKLGSTTSTGSVGNTAIGAAVLGGDPSGPYANVEFFAFIRTSAPQWTAYRAAVVSKYPGVLV